MSQPNNGPTCKVRTRVSVITLFGVLILALTFLMALSGCGSFATTSPSTFGDGSSTVSNEMYGQVISSLNQGTSINELYAVDAMSANDVWAVGSSGNNTNPDTIRTLIQHWDGSAWSIVPSPNPGAHGNYLRGVAAVSTDDVWAVGSSSGSGGGTLIERWNGTSWSVVPNPSECAGGNILYAVAAVSTDDVWAVGSSGNGGGTLIEHWNGTSWSVVPSPKPGTGAGTNILYAVAAVSANDVWAVGFYEAEISGLAQTLIVHWNGAEWSVVPSRSPGSTGHNYLYGVAAVSANDVWAVGSYDTGSKYQTLVEHWNGTSWIAVPSANLGLGNYLRGVTAVSAKDVWAVGDYYDGRTILTLVERWNGSEWSVVASPSLDQGVEDDDNYLYAVAAVSATDVWAVGAMGYNVTHCTGRTLVERYVLDTRSKEYTVPGTK